MSRAEPWTVRHRPKRIGDVAGNRQPIELVRTWLEAWRSGNPPSKKALLLYGPPGVGKTVISEAMAREHDWDIVEVNASEKRTGDDLTRVVGTASTQSTLYSKGRLILLDEVDGINLRADHGAIEALLRLIRETAHPVVLTANDPWDPKIRPLRDACQLVELKKIGLRDGLPFLKGILDKEDVRAEEEALRLLLEKNDGDLRSVLNDLQTIAGQGKLVTVKDVDYLPSRDRTENIFAVLRIVFNARTVAYAKRALRVSDVDPDMLFQWIFENVPAQIPERHELSEAMQALAEADLFNARTRKTQNWGLSSYALDLMTAGVAMSKQTPAGGWVPMRFPQRIMAMSRSRGTRELRKNVGLRIGGKCHLSSRKALQHYLPLLRTMHEKDPAQYERTAGWLGARNELDEYLTGKPPSDGDGKVSFTGKSRRPKAKVVRAKAALA